jgi:microtubule-associated protein-like 6
MVDYDPEMLALFVKVPPGEGDEFGAVKPWLGAIKAPKNPPKNNPSVPDQKFKVDWVYGYRNEDTRMNCHFN